MTDQGRMTQIHSLYTPSYLTQPAELVNPLQQRRYYIIQGSKHDAGWKKMYTHLGSERLS
jgi:hypothetical protein